MNSKLTRRRLLSLGVGAAQVALLDRFGLNPLRAGVARAAHGTGPTKLLTIMVAGGWQPWFFFNPLRLRDVERFLPPPRMSAIVQEPMYCTRTQLERNLDGTPAVDPSSPGAVRPLRVPRLWDEANLAATGVDLRVSHPMTGLPTCSFGYAWAHPAWRLWENAVVVHGVDQGTPAHLAGQIAALCGYAGQDFAAPGVHAVVANAMLQRFPDRPLPAVTLGATMSSNRKGLPAEVGATAISDAADLSAYLSESNNASWAGLRSTAATPDRGRRVKAQLSFSGQPRGMAPTHPIDDFALAELRRMHGKTNTATDGLLEKLYDGYQTVSKTLAADVVNAITNTPGFEHTPVPTWAPAGMRFGFRSAGSLRAGFSGTEDFELALKLLKSNTTTSIGMSLRVPIPAGGGYFDSHGGEEYNWTWQALVMEEIGRFVAEMKATPGPNGMGTLLDDTLVMVVSDFSRTWPIQGISDHWPVTSVMYISGEGISGNRQIGAYDVDTKPPSSDGFEGVAIPLKDENGDTQLRSPRAHDTLYSAYHLFGIDRFMPDGPGEIIGLRAGT